MMLYPKPWMSPAQRVVVALALSAGLALLAACGGGVRQQIVPSQFSSYPRTETLDLVIAEHVNAGNELGEKRILLTTWFPDGNPQTAKFCSVREDGQLRRWQYVHQAEAALRSSPRMTLPPETVRVIGIAASELPPSQQPPLENMVIVSYWKEGAWETRLYDRMNRPAPVSTIFEITNMPITP